MWRVKERWWFPSHSLLAMPFTEVHYTGGKFRYEFSFLCTVCEISIKHPSRESEVDILLLNTQSWTSEKRCVLKVYIWKLSLSNGWRFEYIWDCLHRILGGRGRKKGRRRRRREEKEEEDGPRQSFMELLTSQAWGKEDKTMILRNGSHRSEREVMRRQCHWIKGKRIFQ